MNMINNYTDLKFAIRCVDVWKNLIPASDELSNAFNYHMARSKNKEGKDITDEKISTWNSISLQDYLELMMDVIQEETGTWFFLC